MQRKRSKIESEQIHQKYHEETTSNLKIVKEHNFTYRLLIESLNKHLEFKDKEILDIGCGAGTLSLYMAHKGGKVVGLDISSKAIAECKRSANHLGLPNASFSKSYFPNTKLLMSKFDYIVFTEVIEHLENDKKAIKAISSLLKIDGILILSTPSVFAPLNKLGYTSEFDKRVGHIRRYTISQLHNLLKKNDFKIIKTKKTEGILRNFLFVNPYAGKLVRILNYSKTFSNLMTSLDNVSLKLFGESNYIIVARKKA